MNIFNFDLESLATYLGEKFSLKPYVAKQIYSWLYKKHVYDPKEWSDIKKEYREIFIDHFEFDLPKVAWRGESTDGTIKFLLEMSDGNSIEAVVIPAKERRTLCVSSQVGCAIGCTFCHTGTQGLTRHLQTHEVLGQYVVVNNWLRSQGLRPISNIVYMGQGEPLHNYDNVEMSIKILLEPHGIGLGQRRITLSTSGLVPKIEKMSTFPPVNIAISLHAAHDDVRSELMPINKRYDLKRLFEAISKIPLKASRRITYEYILIKDFNDGKRDVAALSKLLNRRESKINIIPFNEYPGSPYLRPSDTKILSFQNALIREGYTCTVRVSKGDDILAACGQLKTQKEKLNLWSDEVRSDVQLKKVAQEFR